MTGYWAKHRLLFTVILAAVLAVVTVFLFIFPYIEQNANMYNEQSIYKNTRIDFVVPEPSFEQVETLPGSNGIVSVYPFFLTKTGVNINGREHTTTVLISQQTQDLELTMYNKARLIRKSSVEFDNPIYVDWQFCHDTSAEIGDTITIAIGNQRVDCRIYAIYETNSLYAGGAILLPVSQDIIDYIAQQSMNNGYSGMYVVSSDYNLCRQYLTSDYRPLGRLKNRNQFGNDEQYQIHYEAIMSTGFANEITDFRIKEKDNLASGGALIVSLGALISIIAIIAFNIVLKARGCEKVYFSKQCIPAGKSVKPYYAISFLMESILCLACYSILLTIRLNTTDDYISGSTIGISVFIVPMVMMLAEIVCLLLNFSTCKAAKLVSVSIPVRSETRVESARPMADPGSDHNGNETDEVSSNQIIEEQDEELPNVDIQNKEADPHSVTD